MDSGAFTLVAEEALAEEVLAEAGAAEAAAELAGAELAGADEVAVLLPLEELAHALSENRKTSINTTDITFFKFFPPL
jgi:hypothetical protein